MDGERVDHDAFRAMREHKRISSEEWSSLLNRLKVVEEKLECLERKNDGAIHNHHSNGGSP